MPRSRSLSELSDGNRSSAVIPSAGVRGEFERANRNVPESRRGLIPNQFPRTLDEDLSKKGLRMDALPNAPQSIKTPGGSKVLQKSALRGPVTAEPTFDAKIELEI